MTNPFKQAIQGWQKVFSKEAKGKYFFLLIGLLGSCSAANIAGMFLPRGIISFLLFEVYGFLFAGLVFNNWIFKKESKKSSALNSPWTATMQDLFNKTI